MSDIPMMQWAYVVEICGNGVICRPHRNYWNDDRQMMFSVADVLVFANVKDFCAWSENIFPKKEKKGTS